MNKYKSFVVTLVDGSKFTFSQKLAMTVEEWYMSLFSPNDFWINQDPSGRKADIFIPKASISYVQGVKELSPMPEIHQSPGRINTGFLKPEDMYG